MKVKELVPGICARVGRVFNAQLESLVCGSTGSVVPHLSANTRQFVEFMKTAVAEEKLMLGKEDRAKYDSLTALSALRTLNPELQKYGAYVLEYGAFRAAFMIEGWVVKCILHPSLAEANEAEFRFLSDVPPDRQQYFPEMYNLGEGVLLQKHYTVSFKNFMRNAAEIVSVANELGIKDVYERNVGWTEEGKFVFIDFCQKDVLDELLRKRFKLLSTNYT